MSRWQTTLAAGETSEVVPGYAFLPLSGSGVATAVGYQVVRADAGTDAVDATIEIGIPDKENGDAIAWDTFATVADADLDKVTPFNLVVGAAFRVVNGAAGADITVLFG